MQSFEHYEGPSPAKNKDQVSDLWLLILHLRLWKLCDLALEGACETSKELEVDSPGTVSSLIAELVAVWRTLDPASHLGRIVRSTLEAARDMNYTDLHRLREEFSREAYDQSRILNPKLEG